jgi:hypothetical protein
LAGQSGFHSVDGKASATTLGPESMDFTVAAQAFRRIFDRYQGGGQVALENDTRVHRGHGERLRTWTREKASCFRSEMHEIPRSTGRTRHIFADMQIFLETPARKWRRSILKTTVVIST